MEAQQQKDEAFAQHQKTVNDMLAGMQESSNGMVLSLELKSDTIFNMKVSNSWYLMKENEKQYFAEEMFKQFNQLAQEWAGRDSVLAIYDESGNEVAITRLSGGMKIKR